MNSTKPYGICAEIHLLPGRHTVEVLYDARGRNWYGASVTTYSVIPKTVSFDVLAGHTYAIVLSNEDLAAGRWNPQIKDISPWRR